MLSTIQTLLATHQAFAALIIWPLFTAVFNFVFHSLETSPNKAIQGVAVFLKVIGVDSPKAIAYLHSLLDKPQAKVISIGIRNLGPSVEGGDK